MQDKKTHTHTLVSFGGRLPVLCTDHRQAHLALLVDVGVIDLCLECDLGGLEGILRGEDDFDSERAFVIRRVVLQAEIEKTTTERVNRWEAQVDGWQIRRRNEERLLTGTMSPCHDNRFDSST